MWKVHRGILSSYMMDREIGTWKVGNRNENHIIKIQIYLSHFEKIVSDYNDFINTLNKFRKLARNKIINLSK